MHIFFSIYFYDIGCIISKWLHIVDCLATSQRLKQQLVQQRSKYQENKTIEIPLSPLHHCRRLWKKKPISLWASFPGWCFAEQSSEQPSTLSPFVPHLLLARNHSALILPHTQFHFFAKQMCHTPTHAHTYTYTHTHKRVHALSAKSIKLGQIVWKYSTTRRVVFFCVLYCWFLKKY